MPPSIAMRSRRSSPASDSATESPTISTRIAEADDGAGTVVVVLVLLVVLLDVLLVVLVVVLLVVLVEAARAPDTDGTVLDPPVAVSPVGPVAAQATVRTTTRPTATIRGVRAVRRRVTPDSQAGGWWTLALGGRRCANQFG